MRLGRFGIYPIRDGRFRLDGGAMFGIVPRVLWEKTNPPDDRNRIEMSLGVLLVEAHGKKILIDTGIGNKVDAKSKDIYAVDRNPPLEEELARRGVSPDDIDIVINTHLHFDHCGGNTRKSERGAIEPTFRKAKYFIQRGEYDFARTPNERTHGSYLAENYERLIATGQVELLDGDTEVLPGIHALVTPGHLMHHQSVVLESDGRKAIFWGDLIPTCTHVRYPYIMGYDLFPLLTLETKKRLLPRAHEEGWLLVFQHDPAIAIGKLAKQNDRLIVEPIERW